MFRLKEQYIIKITNMLSHCSCDMVEAVYYALFNTIEERSIKNELFHFNNRVHKKN